MVKYAKKKASNMIYIIKSEVISVGGLGIVHRRCADHTQAATINAGRAAAVKIRVSRIGWRWMLCCT